ncbi:13586_t:CDS:2 [Entrophospora sp. SA101]|nr:13586_t:CDS:2 [Entrophospora sp. SA101]
MAPIHTLNSGSTVAENFQGRGYKLDSTRERELESERNELLIKTEFFANKCSDFRNAKVLAETRSDGLEKELKSKNEKILHELVQTKDELSLKIDEVERLKLEAISQSLHDQIKFPSDKTIAGGYEPQENVSKVSNIPVDNKSSLDTKYPAPEKSLRKYLRENIKMQLRKPEVSATSPEIKIVDTNSPDKDKSGTSSFKDDTLQNIKPIKIDVPSGNIPNSSLDKSNSGISVGGTEAIPAMTSVLGLPKTCVKEYLYKICDDSVRPRDFLGTDTKDGIESILKDHKGHSLHEYIDGDDPLRKEIQNLLCGAFKEVCLEIYPDWDKTTLTIASIAKFTELVHKKLLVALQSKNIKALYPKDEYVFNFMLRPPHVESPIVDSPILAMLASLNVPEEKTIKSFENNSGSFEAELEYVKNLLAL